MECYCVARNKPIRREITKPQTATVISLWFWGLLACLEVYCDWPVHNQQTRTQSLFMCFWDEIRLGKALDNIDLNQMSHRHFSGVLQNDWNDPDFRSLDRSQRGCCIWVSLSYKTVNIVVSVIDSAVYSIALNNAAFGLSAERWFLSMLFSVNTSRNPINIDRNAKPNRNSAAAPKNWKPK